MEQIKEDFIKSTYQLIIKDIQTTITIAYGLVVAIGMVFNYQKYASFSINIFEYSDVFDFLIAPFSDIHILGFALASSAFIIFIFYLDDLIMKNFPKFYSIINFGRDKNNWFKTYRVIFFVACLTYYLFLSAKYYGEYSKQKTIGQNDIIITLANNEVKRGVFIGKSKDVIFLYKNNGTYIIPITSLVKEIKIK